MGWWMAKPEWSQAHYLTSGGAKSICLKVGKYGMRLAEPLPENSATPHCPACVKALSETYGSEAGEREMSRRYFAGESTRWVDFDPAPFRTAAESAAARGGASA